VPDPAASAPRPGTGRPPGGDAPWTLLQAAAVIGGYRWLEHRLFEIVGGWVTTVPIAAVQVHLDAQSARHAWHAELWADRLPVLAGVDPEGLTKPPGRAAAAVIAALGGSGSTYRSLEDPDDHDTDRTTGGGPGALPLLAGLYRVVLPRLVMTYRRHLEVASPVTDGPTIRALRLVLADEVEDWHDGERLVERLVARPHDVRAVAGFLQHLESAVVAEGVTVGLVTLPDPGPPT